MERAASLREQDPVEAVRELRAAVASLRVATHPVEFGLAHYDLAGLLLEGDAPTDVLEEAARAAARALLVFDPQELPDLFAGASERLGMAQWQAGRRKDAQRTFRQTAGSLAAVQRFGLGARLLAIQARLMGRAAGSGDGIGVGDAIGAYDAAIETARRADESALLASLLNDSGRLVASSHGTDSAPHADAALTRFDEAAALVDDADLGAALPVHGNRAAAYGLRETGDRDANLREAIASYQRAVHLPGLKAYPADAARLYRAMGTAWAQRPGGDRVENLRQADGALQSAIDRMPDDAQRDERASMWNERGLAQAELAQRGIPGAVTATVMALVARRIRFGLALLLALLARQAQVIPRQSGATTATTGATIPAPLAPPWAVPAQSTWITSSRSRKHMIPVRLLGHRLASASSPTTIATCGVWTLHSISQSRTETWLNGRVALASSARRSRGSR